MKFEAESAKPIVIDSNIKVQRRRVEYYTKRLDILRKIDTLRRHRRTFANIVMSISQSLDFSCKAYK